MVAALVQREVQAALARLCAVVDGKLSSVRDSMLNLTGDPDINCGWHVRGSTGKETRLGVAHPCHFHHGNLTMRLLSHAAQRMPIIPPCLYHVPPYVQCGPRT